MEFNPEAEWPIKQKQKKWPFKDMAMWQTITFDVGCAEWRKIQHYAHCYANDNHKKVRTYYDQARKVGYVQRIG